MADFSDELIEQVWQKAKIVSNNNPDIFRQDYAGAWIRRDLEKLGTVLVIHFWKTLKPLKKIGDGSDDPLLEKRPFSTRETMCCYQR